MLKISDTPIEAALKVFNEYGIDVAFMVPTPTGFKKSIMDATSSVRIFLENHDMHFYNIQLQGTIHKEIIPAFFVLPNDTIETKATLYRPLTKKGDPRIWFYDLKKYCKPGNLLAIFTDNNSLFVLNMSNPKIYDLLNSNSELKKLFISISLKLNHVAMELLQKLKDIYKLGFVKTIVNGDTGIGMTLENLLGIKPNIMSTPDYEGIELKATRISKYQKNRVNLFSQVPDWRDSRLKSGIELLNEFGYYRDGRLQLYCTVESKKPNSQGLFFSIDENNDKLINFAKRQDAIIPVVQWGFEMLRLRLKEKHPETFWVKAKSRFINGIEEFLYYEVIHTRMPSIQLLPQLIDLNIITMDYTLSLLQSGRARDHGYLFKIMPGHFELLFPPPKKYSLNTVLNNT